jgi:broad specificity phosphatase PhoE
MIKITYFVHGTTIDNEQHISSGWKDVGLSDLGIKQSVDLKDKTKDQKLNGASSTIVEPMQEEECITNRFPEGESYEDVKARIADFLEFLKTNYDGKSVAIVAHKAPQLSLDVLLKGKTWKQALAEDWRKTKAWQPGWKYELK